MSGGLIRYVDWFHVILLDMAKTFMFGVDRFSEDEKFGVTYRKVSGKTLNDLRVRQVIRVVIETMQTYYDQWTVSFRFRQSGTTSARLLKQKVCLRARLICSNRLLLYTRLLRFQKPMPKRSENFGKHTGWE